MKRNTTLSFIQFNFSFKRYCWLIMVMFNKAYMMYRWPMVDETMELTPAIDVWAEYMRFPARAFSVHCVASQSTLSILPRLPEMLPLSWPLWMRTATMWGEDRGQTWDGQAACMRNTYLQFYTITAGMCLLPYHNQVYPDWYNLSWQLPKNKKQGWREMWMLIASLT